VRLLIIRPLPGELEGINVRHLAFQGVYEIAAPLCDVLLAMGYAIPKDDLRFGTKIAVAKRKAARKRR
jgi:hypothetical protein